MQSRQHVKRKPLTRTAYEIPASKLGFPPLGPRSASSLERKAESSPAKENRSSSRWTLAFEALSKSAQEEDVVVRQGVKVISGNAGPLERATHSLSLILGTSLARRQKFFRLGRVEGLDSFMLAMRGIKAPKGRELSRGPTATPSAGP